MGPVPTPVDQVNDLLQNLKVDAQGKPTEFLEPAPSQDGNISDSSGDVSVSSGDFMSVNNGHEVTPESGLFYSTNGYATHPGYAYDYTQGVEWEEYPRYVGLNGVDPTIYAENGSVVYHPGYGYPYSPGPFHAIVADGQLYGPSFQYSGPVYQQYPVMEGDHVNGDGSAGGNSKGVQRPGYPVTMIAPHGSYPRGVMAVHNSRQDTRGGYEGLRATAPAWVDMKSTEQRRPSNSTQSNRSLAHQQPSQSQNSTAPPALPGALGTAFPPLTRAVLNASATGKGGRGLNGNGVDNRGNGTPWVGIDRTKPKGKGAGVLSNGNGSLDVLTEQNRGPRTSKVRSQRVTLGFFRQPKGQGEEAAADNVDLTSDQYNRPDFATSYEDAKFFIIKSYSEDDVHKSIKYSVWASTPNGNKRLDAAYQEAQVKADSKKGGSPVFLFFSVNASGQFCGVAEMTGPVDFIKSMDFWQQDKWSGRFSVKWHIIKDIPNSQFRHIILENNDNKPVTNSRDTQEVKFGQGIEMLKIFKHYPSNTSILDDFQYYESRQKAMQEKRSRQQQRQQGSVLHNADPVSKTKNEDNVVIVENGKVNQSTEDVVSSNSKDDAVEAPALPKKSYLRSLAGEKDAANIEVDVKAG